MKIKILGTRAQVELSKPWHSRKSGVLIDGKILLDLGEPEYLKYHPEMVFLTHLHPDHAFFVEEKGSRSLDIPVYGPEPSDHLRDIIPVRGEVHFGEYRVTPIPVIHSLRVKSLGYLVRKGDKRIFYTGDVAWIEKQYHNRLWSLDMVVTEASTIRPKGLVRRDPKTGRIYGHTGVPDLIRLFRPFTRRIVFMHLGTWILKDLARGRQKIKAFETDGLSLDVAFDGKEYEI